VTAYGKLAKLPGGYMLALGQQADGVPVYWAASLYDAEMGLRAGSNRLEVVVGDSGLVSLYGHWSTFTPAKQDIPVLSEQEAIAVFASMGETADTAEL
jgi:hypothetical protein